MINHVTGILLMLCWQSVYAQKHRSLDTGKIYKTVDSINRALDKAIVEKNVALLQKYYADDFVFHHGSGIVDNKASWLKYVTSERANLLHGS